MRVLLFVVMCLMATFYAVLCPLVLVMKLGVWSMEEIERLWDMAGEK